MGYYGIVGTHTSKLAGYFESKDQAVAEWKKIVGEDKCLEVESEMEGMPPGYFMFETRDYPKISKVAYVVPEDENKLGKLHIYVKKSPDIKDVWVTVETKEEEKEVEEEKL